MITDANRALSASLRGDSDSARAFLDRMSTPELHDLLDAIDDLSNQLAGVRWDRKRAAWR